MGVYVTVRGWLECDHTQLARIEELVATAGADQPYSGGWAFPARQAAWTTLVFFGADMREQYVGTVLDQLRAVARVPASDEDQDLVRGIFVVSHETEGTEEWRVHAGEVAITNATARYFFLDE